MKKMLMALSSSVLLLALATGCAAENEEMNNNETNMEQNETNTEQNDTNTGETNEE
ncbi:hypothetical protein LG307_13510 [Sutcliffiella horikoshii]|uniref:hypothetical protein n=1 Tax=Sutcliffiella horikoshii TaxID=79883 RepID=UPI00384C7111